MTQINEQIIVRGDDTYFNGRDLLGSITFVTQINMTNWSAEFYYQNVKLKFSSITDKTIQPRFTREQTKCFQPGLFYAKLTLFDADRNKQTEFTDLPYRVVEKIAGNYVSSS